MADVKYKGIRRVAYGDAVFIPVCPHCGRFVKADPTMMINDEGLIDQPNATCSKCGRIMMIFDMFYS